jgi:hypothetical protein
MASGLPALGAPKPGLVAEGPYGELGRPPLAALLTSGDGVFFWAGLDGIARLGLLPAKVDSDGLRDQENMSAPGIFQPLLQPVCVPATTTTTTAIRVQLASFIRMAINSFGSLYHRYRQSEDGLFLYVLRHI